MKLKKIISTAVASALALSTMALTAISANAADPITVKLYSQNTDSWTLYESADSYDITGNGDYTFTVDAGSEEHYITLYVKDVAAAEASDDYANAVMTINSVTVNGKKLGLTQTDFPLLNEDTGVLDVCLINGWATTYAEADEAPFDQDGDSFTFGEPVETFEINCTISGIGGEEAAAPATEAPAAETETTSAETGNTSAAVMFAVIAVAGTTAVVCKKRK